MAETTPDLDILARPGGNDRVVGKKVLLAELARHEAARLGITPGNDELRDLRDAFLRDMRLDDEYSIAAWLAETGLSRAEFNSVVSDLACVLAVEAHHETGLAARTELHRRFMSGRNRRLAKIA